MKGFYFIVANIIEKEKMEINLLAKVSHEVKKGFFTI